jgi:hypothetical protein
VPPLSAPQPFWKQEMRGPGDKESE